MRKILILFLLVVGLSVTPVNALSNITYHNKIDKFSVTPSDFDLFPGFKNLMPNGMYYQEIEFENKSKNEIDFYLKVYDLDPEYEAVYDYLSLNYTIDSLDSGAKSLKITDYLENKKLVTLKSKTKSVLKIVLHVSADLGSEYENMSVPLNWEISVIDKETTDTGVSQDTYLYATVLALNSLFIIFLIKRRQKDKERDVA